MQDEAGARGAAPSIAFVQMQLQTLWENFEDSVGFAG
jgi:hypothetical protein